MRQSLLGALLLLVPHAAPTRVVGLRSGRAAVHAFYQRRRRRKPGGVAPRHGDWRGGRDGLSRTALVPWSTPTIANQDHVVVSVRQNHRSRALLRLR